MNIIVHLIEFIFRLFAWIVITAGCLVYAIWAVLSNRIREFGQRVNEDKIQKIVDENERPI